jgi:hypothetical protein
MEPEEQFYQMPFIKRLVWRFIFACLGAVVAAAFLLLLFYGIHFVAELLGSRIRFRMPVIAFFLPLVGFYIGGKQATVYQPFFSLLFRYSLFFRIFVFCTVFYAVSLTAFVELFEPLNFRRGLDFGRYNLDGRFGDFLKLLLFPPCVLAFGLFLIKKVKPKDG